MRIVIAVLLTVVLLAALLIVAHRSGHLDVSGRYVYISWMTSSDPTDIDKETVAFDFSILTFVVLVAMIGAALSLALMTVLNRVF